MPALSGADQETCSESVVRGTGTATTLLTAAGTWRVVALSTLEAVPAPLALMAETR